MDAMDPTENPNHSGLIKKLGLSQAQLAQAAKFTNSKYPDITLEYDLEDADNITAGSPAYIKINIEREIGEEDEDSEIDATVHAPFYPVKKMENWWLVVGEESTKTLLKRITIGRKLSLRLEYTVPTPGEHTLKLFLMSDSYVGVDQDPSFNVTVAEGMDEDEEEEEDDAE
jgi:pre-mRNA-splicing helicase BRR2